MIPFQEMEQCLRAAYTAFNSRNITAALALMSSSVEWPRAFKGGHVTGHEEIRAYWTEQWHEIDANVEPVSYHYLADNSVLVEVHQVVKDLSGSLLADGIVGHRFTFTSRSISRMDVCDFPGPLNAKAPEAIP